MDLIRQAIAERFPADDAMKQQALPDNNLEVFSE
jgi:hypothetical protein